MPRIFNRILVVADNTSAMFGGEAILPLHYFRMLRKRGVEAWLITHGRTRGELSQTLGEEVNRVHFIPDLWLHRALYRLGKPLPQYVRHFSTGYLMRLITQYMARRMARRMIREHEIDLVHQPTPVAPRESSLIHGLGVPVVMGPMNGAMTYPPAFAKSQESKVSRALLKLGRWVSGAANRLMPGKIEADVLLVANDRTREALPNGTRGQIMELVENGVDLGMWKFVDRSGRTGPMRFVFTGRLVKMKGVNYLLEAMKRVTAQMPARLDIIGDGPMRAEWEALANSLGLQEHVNFHGWIKQDQCPKFMADADVLVLPSVFECGGAVVLEAMATGLPVIASDWGGPADYLDPTCGVLVPPQSPQQFVGDLANAMSKLAADPELRQRMGLAGRAKVEQNFDWDRKIDRMTRIYLHAIDGKAQSEQLVPAPADLVTD
ncbi:MAG TPA: glycosyltransferase family 4 protein [Tepidisphaeraceae bacterium]|nr:glycosyltransferase family 4 protein [Tepidisphaeraceae bacterium]